jgi:hypothetical protein
MLRKRREEGSMEGTKEIMNVVGREVRSEEVEQMRENVQLKLLLEFNNKKVRE